jgi:hypothetical protein
MHLSQHGEPLQSLLPVAAIALLATACGDVVCTLEPRAAIKADIRDSVTNAGAAFHASLVVTNETVYDSSFFGGVSGAPFDTASFSAVNSSAINSRPGIYTVRVRRSGYRLWQRTSVRVGGDRCGADATELLIRLQPTP